MSILSDREKVDLIVRLNSILWDYFNSNYKKYHNRMACFFTYGLTYELTMITKAITEDRDVLICVSSHSNIARALEYNIKNNNLLLSDELFNHIYLDRKIAHSRYTELDRLKMAYHV